MSSPLRHTRLDLPRLRETIERARAASTGNAKSPIVIARLEIDAFDPVRAFGRMAGPERFFWSQPDRAVALVGEGMAVCVETAGEQRIPQAGTRVAEEMSRVFCVDSEGREAVRWLGGFSFDARHTARDEWADFPGGRMILPEWLLECGPQGTGAVLARPVLEGEEMEAVLADFEIRARHVGSLVEESDEGRMAPASSFESMGQAGPEYAVAADRPHAVYCDQVQAAIEAIGAGDFEKVVVARSLEVRHAGRYRLEDFLRRLSSVYPSCTVMALGHGDATLVAASPEFLVSLEGKAVRTQALAGSAARGSSPDQDEDLGRRLVESKKEQHEHAAVVGAVRDALAEVCGELDGPEAPALLKMEGIQHLSTPLSGRLQSAEGVKSVLELVDLLHPTPAVCGLPRECASEWLHAHEKLDRGWYAGPVGWMTAEGDGDFWLALRAGLIRQPSDPSSEGMALARLYAGAGVVEGSRPESELAETRLKLRALLAPLTEI
ncbi:MAG: isochorismate synthase [Myxococcota bacterium]|nr:isochorismate synthase [Myxococcota bacterium]